MKHHASFQSRFFSGILLIAIGAILLLATMEKLDFGDVVSKYWPLVLVIVGLWHLASRGFRRSGFGLFLVALGVFFQLDNWDLISGRVWSYFWPILIIAAGVWILLSPRRAGLGEKIPKILQDDLRAFVLFSGLKRRFESDRFRGGRATAICGGIDIDLTRTKLADNQATVELTAFLGGISLVVPREWKVVVDSSTFLGGIDDKHAPLPSPPVQATLYVRATAVLGGIDIKN